MALCKRAENCSFFNDNMKTMPATADLFKAEYCEGAPESCARNYLFTYLEKKDFTLDEEMARVVSVMSDTLFPNQIALVKKTLPE